MIHENNKPEEQILVKDQKHFSLFSEYDILLFKTGKHFRIYNHLGSHVIDEGGLRGVYFSVWAPNAKSVSLIGDFNFWDRETHLMFPRWDSSGIWEIFVEGLEQGMNYKYFVISKNNSSAEKSDPFAFYCETPSR